MKNEIFSDRLHQAMSEKNFTAKQLSVESGINKSTISEYLSGLYSAKIENLIQLSQTLECDPWWLLGLDTADNPAVNAESFLLDVFSDLQDKADAGPTGQRGAPPEFCDGKHFYLQTGQMAENGELMLCRRQERIRGGQTGIFRSCDGELLILYCEQRKDVDCLIERKPGGRIFINEETENFSTVARVILIIQEL